MLVAHLKTKYLLGGIFGERNFGMSGMFDAKSSGSGSWRHQQEFTCFPNAANQDANEAPGASPKRQATQTAHCC
jgi:hypothetical protein